VIDTERLLLRPLLESDADLLARVWGDPRVMAFCGGAAPAGRLPQVLKTCLENQATLGFAPFVVLIRGDLERVGLCGFKPLPDPEGVELVYHFVPEAWGRGYATEAVRGLLAWSAHNLRASYVEASFDTRNAASGGVLAKAGFTYREERWFEDVQRSEPVHRFELRSYS